MGSPSKTLATLRPDLSSFFEFDLEASRMGFIGLQVLRPMAVDRQAGKFGRITLESLLSKRDTTRAPRGGYNRQDYEFEDHAFACFENGAEEPIDDREEEMYRDYFELETIATMRARDVVLRNLEKRVAGKIFDTAAYNDTAATTSWKTHASAVPIGDVEAAVQRLYDKGIRANALVVSWKRYRDLRQVAEIQDIIAAQGAGDRIAATAIGVEQLRQVFDLQYILVGDSQENTANQGQAASLGAIWDDDIAGVMRVAESNDIREPCIGRCFHWDMDGSNSGMDSASNMGATVESYRDETVRSDIIRARTDTDENIIYPECVELITGVGS